MSELGGGSDKFAQQVKKIQSSFENSTGFLVRSEKLCGDEMRTGDENADIDNVGDDDVCNG